MKTNILVAATLGLGLLGAAAVTTPGLLVESESHAVAKGRNPKFVTRRSHGVMLLYSQAAAGGGMDLYYQSSNDVGETFSPPQRVNHVPGEVSDHGENSAQLLTSPDDQSLYAVWNQRDAKGGSHIRFSRAGAMQTAWSPAITVDDDPGPNSHGFQGAGVGPDGTIYIAWLDGRDKEKAKTGDYTSAGSAVYLTRSTDGGKTFSKNIRISTDVCPCCRVSFAVVGQRVFFAWRGVDSGDMRDIYVASSQDKGETWNKPTAVSRDKWKINGCPHVGPSLASLNVKLHVTWFSEGSGKPGIYTASSGDGGETFGPRRLVSEGVFDPTHPMTAASEDRIGVVFQAREGKDGWGKMAVFYRELSATGVMSKVVRVGTPKTGSVVYPSLALGMSGRIVVGWTEVSEGIPTAYMIRARHSD